MGIIDFCIRLFFFILCPTKINRHKQMVQKSIQKMKYFIIIIWVLICVGCNPQKQVVRKVQKLTTHKVKKPIVNDLYGAPKAWWRY